MTTKTAQSKTIIEHKGQLVNTAHVDSLISTYKKERWIQNSERLGKNDSLSTWYGLPELETFIQKAKDHKADGIRIYFGVYPKDFATIPEYQGRQTVILVATKEKHTKNGILNKDLYINNNSGSHILAFNLGFVCPPFCNNNLFHAENQNFGTERIGISIIELDNKIIVI